MQDYWQVIIHGNAAVHYVHLMCRIADVRAASAVLQWDQETYLPAGGAQFRGQQISTLSELAHELFSDEALGNLLNELAVKNCTAGSVVKHSMTRPDLGSITLAAIRNSPVEPETM